MRKALLVLLAVVFVAISAYAIELAEVGLQIEIGLRPFTFGGSPRWDFQIGAYARLTLSDQYSARVIAGTGVTPFSPFFDIFLARPMTDEWTLEGELTLVIIPARSVSASAHVGTRLTIGEPPAERWELASFPLGWRLEAKDGAIRGAFLLSGNLLLDLTLASPGPLLIGQGVRFHIAREAWSDAPSVLSIGSGWAMGFDLMTHIGTDF